MKNKSIILSISALTGILVACAPAEETKELEAAILPLVVLEKADISTFEHKINVQGNVETDQDVIVTAEMGGLITNIAVKEGQTVVKGQLLATVDASVLSSNAQELQTQLEYAEYMLEKQEELKKRGVGSEFEYETALNQVKSLKARLNSINTQRGKAQIKAPFSGMIDKVFGRQGEMAGPQQGLVRLVNNSTIEIVADVSEKHLARIHVGTPITVSFPNFKDTTIQLKVTSIGNYIEPTNRTFRIAAAVPKNKVFLPNMLAEVHITDHLEKEALIIPSKSIMKSQENEDYIFIANKDGENYKVERVDIVVVERYNGETMIEQNPKVTKGTMIVVEGGRGIVDKDSVRTK